MYLAETLSRVLARHDELRDALSQPNVTPDQFAKLSKEYAELTPVCDAISGLNRAKKELADAQSLLSDPDMATEAKQEIERLRPRIPELELQVQKMLLPKDIADERNAILEIRAGAGGTEAALFAALLFDMYRKYAGVRGWKFEVMEMSESDLGGLKEGVAEISGRGVFARLKFESGVHRVQRVPQTENQGRVHTSTATVAVLPEMEDVDVHIDEKDLKIDVYRASGAGGQHVNKTESAVRITHMPSGIVVAMQEERSQIKNRAKAMKILRARLYEQQDTARKSAHAAERKSQVGTGDRSERIRTYNFPQGRVSDHRIEMTLYNIDEVVNGTGLDAFIDELIQRDEAEKLAALNAG
ncbi:MAG: peptide chain release factor 1 [Alphaproteobacteria bacterium]|nr:peptide chain release factor 1 [Alphaproteobacteria bacterium]